MSLQFAFELIGTAGFLLFTLFILPGTILADALRHEPAPQGTLPDRGSMTGHGVPYVPGRS
jgi:hypothetical protein